jgi:hypothetical protein
VPGVRWAGADPATGGITVHDHPSAPDAAEFFAEIAAALGPIAEGIGPGGVEAMFQVLGAPPAGARASWGAGIGPNIAPALAPFAAGVLIGRRLGSS